MLPFTKKGVLRTRVPPSTVALVAQGLSTHPPCPHPPLSLGTQNRDPQGRACSGFWVFLLNRLVCFPATHFQSS